MSQIKIYIENNVSGKYLPWHKHYGFAQSLSEIKMTKQIRGYA